MVTPNRRSPRRRRGPGRAAGLLALLLAGPMPAADASPGCPAGQRPPAEWVPAALHRGPHHRLAPCAWLEGHLVRTTLQTRWGALEALSVSELRVRIDELPALARLDALAATDVALRAALDEAAESVTALQRVTRRPLETLGAVPSGAMREARARWRSWDGRFARAMAGVGDAATGAGDAHAGASARPLLPARDEPADDAAGDMPAPVRTAPDALGRWVMRRLDHAERRREWARRLGVDPYTRNPLLAARLDAVAWAAGAGAAPVRLLRGAVPGPAGRALGHAHRLDELAWSRPEADLRERVRLRLLALGCADAEVRRFGDADAFTPPMALALVDALVELQPAAGCDDVLTVAAALDRDLEARYLVDSLDLLLRWRDREPRLQGAQATDDAPRVLDLAGTAPLLRGPRDVLVLPLAVDHLQWTAATRRFFGHPALRAGERTVLIGGTASAASRRALTARGWSLVESLAER